MTSDVDPRSLDSLSVFGKTQTVERHVPLVVVGGGAAGVAAASAAARTGVEVLLIDENPIEMRMMALDVPLYFGQRVLPSVRDRANTLQRILASNDGLREAEEAGVEIMLGTYVWGAFRNSENVRELDGPILGVADAERTWFAGYDRLIVAAGARDLVMTFKGSDRAGVLGANGAWSLMDRYQALAARRMVVLGSGNVGLKTAQTALGRGINVVGIVEVGPRVLGSPELRRHLEQQDVRTYTAHTVRRAIGEGNEIEGLEIVEVGPDLEPVPGGDKLLECDTVVFGIGLVPNVELLDLLGVQLPFQSEKGGFTPAPDEWMLTNVPSVYVAGDVAGFRDQMVLDDEIAKAQGTVAGLAAAESLGAVDSGTVHSARSELARLNEKVRLNEDTGREVHSHHRRWLRSLVNAGGPDVHACQCEEVTRGELVNVQPPRYVEWESEQMKARDLQTLAKDGPVDPDQIKRLTRAGMGYCQGRRCREQVALLLAEEAAIDVSEIPMPTYRPPVRPVSLRVMYADDEPEETRDRWTVWFGYDWREPQEGEPREPRRGLEWGKTVR